MKPLNWSTVLNIFACLAICSSSLLHTTVAEEATSTIILATESSTASENVNEVTTDVMENTSTTATTTGTIAAISSTAESLSTRPPIDTSDTSQRPSIQRNSLGFDTKLLQTQQPSDCSQREKSSIQPIPTLSSRLLKCCPLGENLDIYRENQSDSMCENSGMSFEPTIISAVLYDNCIEDLEIVTTLSYQIGNPCNSSFQYDDGEDVFFVLQDGSLLVMDINRNDSYTIEKNYCIDVDKSGHMFAFTCITQVDEHLARGQMVTVAVLMLVSIPCLLLVSYLHMTLKNLRNLHGLCLSLMSLSLAMGFFVFSVVGIYGLPSGGFIGYVIQFLILSYYFWFFCICCNVILNIWYKLPQCVRLNKTWTYVNFGAYCLFTIIGPTVLVTLTVQKGLQGMPSYFIQGLTESIRESQRYFIPPVSTLLGLSFLAMVISFFGFQRIKTNGYLRAEKDEPTSNAPVPQFDQQKYEDVKKDAKCICLLGIIMIVTWLLEMTTFYSKGKEGYLLLCDMINGLQGVFIFLIFLVVRRRRTVILRWWYDRGSHNIEGTELQTVSKNTNPS
ncbi:probable G-protein coupled receptor Mth-like 14 [Scaptodrosophila lebanonensis]|uniref:Probable G-protein coupled receptor Mth-like 14 n=1 Tax=Drosophila lebanonensis TaxID=7225 RepID=A0A6J2UGX9_DROLE|nr:probable G-protein coupled receptor Mth-like 14 [Scaptodrosophila lebanonensis]